MSCTSSASFRSSMNRRLLPEKDAFGEYVRDRIIVQLEAGGKCVADVVKGDKDREPFDWLAQHDRRVLHRAPVVCA